MGVLGGKYLVVKNAPKVNYPHYHKVLQHQRHSQTILIPTFFKQKPKELYFLQIPPFLVTTNTLNRESNLSSFSFRDIFLLSASESFRVTSLETASSLFCATLKGKEKSLYMLQEWTLLSLRNTLYSELVLATVSYFTFQENKLDRKSQAYYTVLAKREGVQETSKMWFISGVFWILLKRENFPKLGI